MTSCDPRKDKSPPSSLLTSQVHWMDSNRSISPKSARVGLDTTNTCRQNRNSVKRNEIKIKGGIKLERLLQGQFSMELNMRILHWFICILFNLDMKLSMRWDIKKKIFDNLISSLWDYLFSSFIFLNFHMELNLYKFDFILINFNL